MKKKNIIILISAIVLIASAVTAAVVFHKQIADFFTSMKTKLVKSSSEPHPDFTQEEIEVFADI